MFFTLTDTPLVCQGLKRSEQRVPREFAGTIRIGLADVNFAELEAAMNSQKARKAMGNGQSTSPGEIDTWTMLAILGAAFFFLSVLYITMMCYRRKSLRNQDQSFKLSTLSIPEPANRSISFGQMPSWRRERAQARNVRGRQLLFGNLERIKEVDERSRSDRSNSGSHRNSLVSAGPDSVHSQESIHSYRSEGGVRKMPSELSNNSRRSRSTSQIPSEQSYAIDVPTTRSTRSHSSWGSAIEKLPLHKSVAIDMPDPSKRPSKSRRPIYSEFV
ncbi:unnamed protein product, partial [Mesorhabditis spiculigera]